jgi:hypothetical protein
MKAFLLRCALISYLAWNALLLYPQEKLKTEAKSDFIEYTNKEGLPSTIISGLIDSTATNLKK